VNTIFIVGCITIKAMHDTSRLVQGRDDRICDGIDRGRIQHNFIILGHIQQKFVDPWPLRVSPTILAVPGGMHKSVLQVKNKSVGDRNIVWDVGHLKGCEKYGSKTEQTCLKSTDL
jgi:hypothetical protein